MTTLAWVLVGFGAYAFIMLLVWALCAISGRIDDEQGTR